MCFLFAWLVNTTCLTTAGLKAVLLLLQIKSTGNGYASPLAKRMCYLRRSNRPSRGAAASPQEHTAPAPPAARRHWGRGRRRRRPPVTHRARRASAAGLARISDLFIKGAGCNSICSACFVAQPQGARVFAGFQTDTAVVALAHLQRAQPRIRQRACVFCHVGACAQEGLGQVL